MRPYDAGMPGSAPAPPAGAGLEIAPFAAMYFDPQRADLGSLLCPPYDVVEPAQDEALRHSSAHNLVHIVRPRAGGSAGSPAAYERAAVLLAQWRRAGILRRDASSALYVYEQVVAGGTQRGILGAVRIRPTGDRTVLPHENVFPGPVADRLALIKATDAQLEPILLVATAATDVPGLLDRMTDQPAWLEATAADGSRHRVWRVSGSADIEDVRTAVGCSQALIADGHHRYASYQRLQHERQAEGRGAGPWDHGLALLVGAAEGGLTLSAVHRTVGGASLRKILAATHTGFTFHSLPGVDAADAEALLRLVKAPARADAVGAATATGAAGATGGPDASGAARDSGRPDRFGFGVGNGAGTTSNVGPTPVAVVLSDGREAVLVSVRPGATAGQAATAATVTAERLVPQVLGATDDDPRVAYHHEAAEAVGDAVRRRGVAVILPAPRLADVIAIARAGERMPRKSTSFGPKPLSGLVMRLLD